jgi:hypothetical protein
MKTTADILRAAAQTFEQRSAVYQDNNVRAGAMLAAAFPGGIFLSTPQDFERFILFALLFVKMSRYSVQWRDGHEDSMQDTAVYAAMMEALDANRKGP